MLESDVVHKKYRTNTPSRYPNDPEQTMWLALTRKGDTMAFSYIVEKYQQPVYNLCYRMLGNVDDGEDAAQEVFVRAFFKLDSYDDTAKFSTWLFSIASHYCIDTLRKRRLNLVQWGDLGTWFQLPDRDTPPPEKYWYAMSYQEMAQMLETTVSAIKSKLFRARKMLAAKSTERRQRSTSSSSQMVLAPSCPAPYC